MIGVDIHGRLGNQMFQFALANIESKKIGTDYFLLEISKFQLQNYFEIDFNRFKNTLKLIHFWLIHFLNKKIVNEDQQETVSKHLLQFGLDNTMYKGFYQSAKYFQGYELNIKDLFKIRAKYIVDVRKSIAKSQKPLLAVHVRLTDYKNFANQDITLSKQYYINCFDRIQNIDNYEIWILSDDIEEAKKYFNNYSDFHYAEKTHLMTDFQIMQQADMLIVANSTFSWWAAYLNEGKPVFAPKYWLGIINKKEHPYGISDNLSWQWIDS